MSYDTQAWIPIRIPASGDRPALTQLRVLVTQRPDGIWEAESLERRVLAASNGCKYYAYLALREAVNEAVSQDKKLGRIPFEDAVSASKTSFARFEQAPNKVSMSVRLREGRNSLDGLIYLDRDGWVGCTLQRFLQTHRPHNSPSEAFTQLSKEAQRIDQGHAVEWAKYPEAPADLWTIYNAVGHEPFRR